MNQLDCVLVMPAYNERECIAGVISDWHSTLSKMFDDRYLIVVVNDGSTDGTQEVIRKLADANPRLVAIDQTNAGHGAALLKAYRYAVGINCSFVFHVDSDNQFQASDFNRLWGNREASSCILGYRQIRHDSLHRLVISKILGTVLWLLFGVSIEDANVPYRLYKTEYLRGLLAALPQGIFAPNIFLAVLAAKDGQNLLSIPVTHLPRRTGTVSIIRLKLLKVCFRSLGELLAFRWSLGRKISELRRTIAV